MLFFTEHAVYAEMRFDRFVLMFTNHVNHFYPIFDAFFAPNQHAFAVWKSEAL